MNANYIVFMGENYYFTVYDIDGNFVRRIWNPAGTTSSQFAANSLYLVLL